MYNATNDELISGYFRPVTSYLEVPDDEQPDRSFAVFVDRPIAGISRLPGQAEFIIERKSAATDFKGVAELTNDDYEGLYKHRLVFIEGRVQETLRKLQLLEETEVIKIATAITQENVFPDQRVLGPTPMLFDHHCLRPDLMPELSQDTQSLLLRLTSLCEMPLDIKINKLLQDLGIDLNKVRFIVQTTADGILEDVVRESEVVGVRSQTESKQKTNPHSDLGTMEAEEKLAAELQKESEIHQPTNEGVDHEEAPLIADLIRQPSNPQNEDLKNQNEQSDSTSSSETASKNDTTESDLRRRALLTPNSNTNSSKPTNRRTHNSWAGPKTKIPERFTIKPFEIRAYRIYFEGRSQIQRFDASTEPNRKNIRRLQTAPGFDKVASQTQDPLSGGASIVAAAKHPSDTSR